MRPLVRLRSARPTARLPWIHEAARHPRSAAAPKPAPSPADVAALLRRVVAAVEDGTVDASSARACRLVRRLELVGDTFDEIAATDRNPDESERSLQ